MNTIRISATSARNNFFELLNQVATGIQVIIEKDNKEIALLSPKTTKTNWKGLLTMSKKVRGILKDYKDEDNPLRRNGASDFLGQWDKELVKE
jgi:prevent-host-death family protein